MLKHNIAYLFRHWGPGHRHVMAAEEELIHFQRTGEVNIAIHLLTFNLQAI